MDRTEYDHIRTHNMKKRTLTPLLLALGILAATTTTARITNDGTTKVQPAHAAIDLKFNLQPGERYLFSSAVKQEITQEAMGQKIVTLQEITTDYLYAVKSKENGITEIDVTMDALKMDTDVGGMQRITFDSNDPEGSTPEMKMMSNIVGKSFQLFINEDGSIEKVVGFEDVFNSTDGAGNEMLKQTFGDSSLVQNMNQITNIYPGKAVDIGDTWVKTFSGTIANMMVSKATTSIELAEVNGEVAVLSMDAQLSFSKAPEAGGNPMLASAEFEMNGTQSGTITVDIASGLPIQSTLKQDISGTMSIQGMEIPISITSDIITTGEKR